jgi:hypothetical protein
MKRAQRILLALALGCGFFQSLFARMAVPPPTAKKLPPHIHQLWNGRDLTGWKTYFSNEVNIAKVWSAKNGVLTLTGEPTGYLRTEKPFSNYHLHFEWRWPQKPGNSGALVHITGGDALWPTSVEYQLRSGIAGEMVSQGAADMAAPLLQGKKRAKISRSSERPAGEWNSGDIYCRGDTIEAQVNGVRQNLVSKVSPTSGAIGLQFEGVPIEFRNLWLEQL